MMGRRALPSGYESHDYKVKIRLKDGSTEVLTFRTNSISDAKFQAQQWIRNHASAVKYDRAEVIEVNGQRV